MTDVRSKRADGVRTMADLQARCRVDGDTGCWHWALAMSTSSNQGATRTPRVWLPAAADGEPGQLTTAARAAWRLSGRRLLPGQVVWRTCGHDDCCAPRHLKAGTKAEEGAWYAATGKRRGNPLRTAVNTANGAKTATPPDVVQQIEALFAEGMLQKDVQARFRLRPETLRSIRLGLHLNSTNRQRVVPQASVFALGASL